MVVDIVDADLRCAIDAQDAADCAASRLALALAEAEEHLDDDASDAAVAEVEALRLRYAEALAVLEEACRCRREVEAATPREEVARVYRLLYGPT